MTDIALSQPKYRWRQKLLRNIIGFPIIKSRNEITIANAQMPFILKNNHQLLLQHLQTLQELHNDIDSHIDSKMAHR